MKLFFRHFLMALGVGLVGVGGGLQLAGASASSASEAPPPEPSLPTLLELKFLPETLVLEHGMDIRKILVWGKMASGDEVDVTGMVRVEIPNEVVSRDSDGFFHPVRVGSTVLRFGVAGLSGNVPVEVRGVGIPTVKFVRDIQPILGKLGCNAGTCHGSAKGKNGFKLSLRGYDADFDYQVLVDDLLGRRFNRVAVDESLMLQKPLAEVPHEGGQVIVPGSLYHRVLRGWIEGGVPTEGAQEGRAVSLWVIPSELHFDLPGRRQHLVVLAKYHDGSTREVTREAVFASNNPECVEVKSNGITQAIRRGEAAIQVRYEGLFATQEVVVMGDRSGFVWQAEEEHNFIDRHVLAKLKKVKILPSDVCTDAEFMRRVYLDLTGVPPSGEKVKAFLADARGSKEKRDHLIDQLLASSEYVEYWSNKWADLLQCNSKSLGDKGVWLFRDWIRQSIAKNAPYDQFVKNLLSAQGSAYEHPEVNYFRALRETGKMTEDISQTFLGVRFNCNKCHDHPFEKWTQNQYYEFGAHFAQISIKRGRLPGEEVVYASYSGGEVLHPKTDQAVPPQVPFSRELAEAGNQGRQERFVAWLTSKDNPLFAKAMANRTWSYFFGRGIIEPVDDIRGSNPPINAPLLDALTETFISSGFDIRVLMRQICQSRTYQRSFRANQWNEDDTLNFSHALPRRLSAEQLLDAVSVASGKTARFAGMPVGTRASELPDGAVPGDNFLALFGRPKRESACECERTSNLSLAHAMNLINGGMIADAVNAGDNGIAGWIKNYSNDRDVVEAIYYSVLNRPPSIQELDTIRLEPGENRLTSAQDLVWALMNTPAFLFNR